MSAQLDVLVGELFYCFPADSSRHLQQKLEARIRRRLTTPIWRVISYVRRQNARLLWTIPHVKRGKAFGGRYIRVRCDGEGRMIMDGEVARVALDNGQLGTMKQVNRMFDHQAAAYRAAGQLTTSRRVREYCEMMAEDMEAMKRKAARLATIVTADRDAA